MNAHAISYYQNVTSDKPNYWSALITQYLNVRDHMTLQQFCKSHGIEHGIFKGRLYASDEYKGYISRDDTSSNSGFIEANVSDSCGREYQHCLSKMLLIITSLYT